MTFSLTTDLGINGILERRSFAFAPLSNISIDCNLLGDHIVI